MLFKSLEFKNDIGQKVKIIDIPVLEEDNTFHFMISARLEVFIKTVYYESKWTRMYSFREYLKKELKWPVYQKLFQKNELKNNA
ncbi:DUF2535 family protein [Peribacillus deserti]|uniref:DUF2535 domain-containing protein n=1 Tax=Peribacillus deserti TaxID=673318 RepID=A0A2N5M380_9BACI|nr:DUF2535 family protein [Peribacillus deserti]PLT28733.1 DUF2535 domain-containing protein [Peribacillus deserti]